MTHIIKKNLGRPTPDVGGTWNYGKGQQLNTNSIEDYEDYDDLPKKISSRKSIKFKNWDFRYYRSKINYKLINRYLESKIGQVWDKVYSEISNKFSEDYRLYVGRSVYTTPSEVIKIRFRSSYDNKMYEQMRLVHCDSGHIVDSWVDLYVDANGILRKCDNKIRYRLRLIDQPDEHNPNPIEIDSNTKLIFEDGIWYMQTITMRERYEVQFRGTPQERIVKYKHPEYKKKQLSKKELKKYNLRNRV